MDIVKDIVGTLSDLATLYVILSPLFKGKAEPKAGKPSKKGKKGKPKKK